MPKIETQGITVRMTLVDEILDRLNWLAKTIAKRPEYFDPRPGDKIITPKFRGSQGIKLFEEPVRQWRIDPASGRPEAIGLKGPADAYGLYVIEADNEDSSRRYFIPAENRFASPDEVTRYFDREAEKARQR